MSTRSKYNSKDADRLFCYYMKTYLRGMYLGIDGIEFDVDFECDPQGFVLDYLKSGMEYVMEGQPPDLLEIIMKTELYDTMVRFHPNKEQIYLMVMIKEMIHWIQSGDLNSFLETGNVWGKKANEYACLTFYPNLSEDILKKEGLDVIVEHTPKDMLRPDDFKIFFN